MLDTTSPGGQDQEQERDTGNGDPASHLSSANIGDEPVAQDPSLGDDLSALIDDGKAYVEAEIAFQKSRAAFAAHEVKAGAAFALVTFAFLHLALMGIVIGLIIALAPIVGPFLATAIMGGALLVLTAVFGSLAIRRFRRISNAFDKDDEASATGETVS